MLQNLKEVYASNALFYYCNACGDINIPGTDPASHHQTNELPEKYRILYERHRNEESGCSMYVVNYNGEPAMALGYLYDRGWLEDLLGKSRLEVSEEDMAMLFSAVSAHAKTLESEEILDGCEILLGEDTDPDGHEILVIVPFDDRNQIKEIAKALYNMMYDNVHGRIYMDMCMRHNQ